MGDRLLSKIGMGVNFLTPTTSFKRSFRFLVNIPDLSSYTMFVCPPEQASRPSYTINTRNYDHFKEVVPVPVKIKYDPVDFVWYDIVQNCTPQNPILNWLFDFYNPKTGIQNYPNSIKKRIQVGIYGACGNIQETWIYENAFPSAVRFGSLSMSSNDYLTINVNLNYESAYWIPGLGY
jgi:hypothetical protein